MEVVTLVLLVIIAVSVLLAWYKLDEVLMELHHIVRALSKDKRVDE